ncbi:LexA-binding, inner membrane-associated putative hydrolase [Candidatus Norongarragalina meridionalis]|nr:LexA-binding, inner membrane-associated putative hydrolase [Candidatus Norongarragalina meridionalis]
MNAFWHAAAALLLCGALSLAVPVELSPQLAAVILLGGLAPDVDNSKSNIFRLIVGSLAVCAGALAYLSLPSESRILGAIIAAIAVVLFVLLIKPRHRGITHSFLALAVFALVVFALTRSEKLALYGGTAFFSHLLADGEFKLA